MWLVYFISALGDKIFTVIFAVNFIVERSCVYKLHDLFC